MRNKGLTDRMSDRRYLEKLWKCEMGCALDLDHPQTFNEKLQWLKLNDHDPLYHTLADKIEVKQWVAKRLGEEFIIPTLGVWSNPDIIEYDNLPERFVLKCNHNSGLGMYICTDRSKMDTTSVNRMLSEGLSQNYYLMYREWAYKDIAPRILAEEYMECTDETAGRYGLIDYKVHCFNGKPLFIEVIGNRDHASGTARSDLYDFDWRKLNFSFGDYPSFDGDLPRPQNLEGLYKSAETLSGHMKYVRTDFYEINGSLKFGEITFYPNAGMVYYNSVYTPETDLMLGKKIVLD